MTDTFGYARVSTADQNPDSQERLLIEAGATRVFVDHGQSSRRRDRPQWIACLDYLRPGDTLLVVSLDRLAGTQALAIETINDLGNRGIHLKSLTEPEIDTTTPMGRAMLGIVAVFAQLRVDSIRANTVRGLEHARAQGRTLGRRPALTPNQRRQAVRWRNQGRTVASIAAELDVSRATVYRAFAQYEHERDSRRESSDS